MTLSPIDTIPNELLCTIFAMAHALSYSDGHLCPRIPTEVAMSVVCKNWRSIALSSPSLWSVYRCIKPSSKALQSELERLETYLKRSDETDIELSFNFIGLHGFTDSQIVSQLLHSTLPHIARWICFVAISDGQDQALVPFHHPLKSLRAPKLRHVDIRTGAWHDYRRLGWDTEPHWNPKMFHGELCAIEYLRLDTCAIMARFRPRLETLVHFMMEEGPGSHMHALGICLLFSNFVQVLSAPNIETISIWGTNYEWWPSQPLPATTIQANRLKHFRYGNNVTMSPLMFFLNRVSAPLLESITIQKISLSNQASEMDHPEDDYIDYAFPSFRSLYLIDVDVACLAVAVPPGIDWLTEIILETPIPRLAQTTRLATHLTIATRATSCGNTDIPLFIDLLPGRRMGHFAESPSLPSMWPQAQDLALHFPSSVFAANNLSWKDTWSKVDRLYLAPPTSNNPWPDPEDLSAGGRNIAVKGLQALGHTQWPPGWYQWASCDKTIDVFLRNTAF
ncbi:hypothetical protein D9611_004057 [Ephemerocybe angulata]|uniref:F-box domain-containing protein n=1 Tax=Ephemerocybe angulata TaxID=980116 RepID=A0A8H5F5I8_9AGAR|nr:hypothetical protein D9611_004057 [Tulosesus angulatus]